MVSNGYKATRIEIPSTTNTFENGKMRNAISKLTRYIYNKHT